LKVKDDGRSEWLKTKGWKILRFWNNDVLQNIEGILEVISSHIRPPS
jgi:very-short-patch-repair endonuclease